MAAVEVATTTPAFQETQEQIAPGQEVATPESETLKAQPVLIEEGAKETESEETVDVDHENKEDSVYSPDEPDFPGDEDEDDEEVSNNDEAYSTEELQVED